MRTEWSENVYYYQSIPELGIKGRMNTPEEFEKIGLPKDLRGWSVLDIGCNIGAFLYESFKRGSKVLCGVEPNDDWRWLCGGILGEHAPSAGHHIMGEISEVCTHFDLVLLLSVTHLVPNPQEIIDKAWKYTRKLLIIEVNHRLQKIPITLPKEAKIYGTNKDGRTVYHCIKGNG